MTQWPKIEFCPVDFDPRFRPWYAGAVSGPRDLVLVIDTSGSMTGERIEMARRAVLLALKTLTWVDYVSIVLFSDYVKDRYSTKLVRATEEEKVRLANWVSSRMTAGGGTNFFPALNVALDMLKSTENIGHTTCTQSIMFLTDGQAYDWSTTQFEDM